MNTRRHYRKIVIFVLSFALIFFVAKAYYDTNTIEIKHYQIKNSSFGEVLQGRKIAHLSDLHIKQYGPREEKIIKILGEENPDLILLTGDYIHFKGPYEALNAFFSELKAPLGIYAVLGNTEYSNENGSCILCHEERSKVLKKTANVTFLRNASAGLKVDGQTLNIIGVDDPVEERSRLRTTLERVSPNRPSILLAHSPGIFEEASRCQIDLLLCGHNHAGQIFITKHLRYILPLDPILEFLEGFFQKGRTLMYVNRGIGTSFFPFRLGVKPEITFLSFSNDTNSEKARIARMYPTNPSNSSNPINPTAALQHGNTLINAIKPISVSNNPSKTIFTGVSFSSFVATFNIFNIFDLFGIASAPPHSRNSINPIDSRNPSNPIDPKVLFDFESDEDLKRLNWQCYKWFELTEDNATSGRFSLKMTLPAGDSPGIDFHEIERDWHKYKDFKIDVFNPSREQVRFHVRIDDQKSSWEYAKRFEINFCLSPGLNHIVIPTDSIRTNINSVRMDLKRIERLMVFIPYNTEKREIYIDHIRLE